MLHEHQCTCIDIEALHFLGRKISKLSWIRNGAITNISTFIDRIFYYTPVSYQGLSPFSKEE